MASAEEREAQAQAQAQGEGSASAPADLYRRIITRKDLEFFTQSSARRLCENFIALCCDAMRGKALGAVQLCTADPDAARYADGLVRVLEGVEGIAAFAASPEQRALAKAALDSLSANSASAQQRFGDPVFRVFYDRVRSGIMALLAEHLPSLPGALRAEIGAYLEHSFGDRQRIDYGTGHETNFMCALLLAFLGYKQATFTPAALLDYAAAAAETCGEQGEDAAIDMSDLAGLLVSKAFVKYLHLMRRIQADFLLEPAGSHGVWGLDDYHALPFVFGASQLIDHPSLRPSAIHDKLILEDLHKDFLYLDMIRFTNLLKSHVSLKWHSPLLNDISGSKSWAHVARGMRKLYADQVLQKLPVMQHFWFGETLGRYFSNHSNASLPDDTYHSLIDGHKHVYAMGQEFPTCCGMRVPSIHASNQRSRLNAINPESDPNYMRPLPSD